MQIVWKGSPNFDNKRKPITHIIIHWFGIGTLESANIRFQTPNNSSAHYGISGDTVFQWVKEENVAYHAGNYAMNQKSIGIEHDATAKEDAHPHDLSEESYKTSAKLISDISKRYNIPLDREHVIGHKEVKATQCPGTIDIDKIIRLAKEYLEDMPNWLKELLRDDLNIRIEGGIEGQIREDVGSIVNKINKYNDLQKRVAGLEKEVSDFASSSASFEEQLRLSNRSREELTKEVEDLKKEANKKDEDISTLKEKVESLTQQLDPEKIVVLKKEEYEQLLRSQVVEKMTISDLVKSILKKLWERR